MFTDWSFLQINIYYIKRLPVRGRSCCALQLTKKPVIFSRFIQSYFVIIFFSKEITAYDGDLSYQEHLFKNQDED